MDKRTSTTYDYLNGVSEFIAFLSVNELTINEILSHIVQVVLAPLNAEAITLDFLNDKSQVENISRWGMPSEMIKDYVDIYNINDRYPSTDTLRFRTTTYVNTLPNWGAAYPLLEKLPYTTGAKSFIAFPIEKAGTPVAALGVFSRDVIHPDTEIESFLKTIGSVFSMYMFRQDYRSQETLKASDTEVFANHPDSDGSSNKLSERQQVILRLISQDRTNFTIGELLGYSESTIRQETIKIYAILGCTGRKEAAKIFKAQVPPSKS